jgi:hypothetical protein
MPAGLKLGSVLDQLSGLFTDPMSNLGAALALYAMVAIVITIVIIVGVMLVLSGSDDETDEVTEQAAAADEPEAGEPAESHEEPVGSESADEHAPPRRRRSKLATAVIVLATLAIFWATTGYSTSGDSACAACHDKSPHASADKPRDPHAGVTCVACHEPGGAVSRAITGVGPRILHVIGHIAGGSVSRDYGRVTRSACASCHASAIARTTVDAARGIRMSHKEPLAAGATCLDCHRLKSGVLLARGVGMSPCIRCHDSKTAPSACATCHDKKAANAARVRTVTPAVQVPQVKCGGCHDQARECDSCHGVRLPHSKEFMTYAHARAGAVDLWFNGGRTCAKCHTATRNPCSRCHSSMLGTGHGPGNALAHQKASSAACDSCHGSRAYMGGRDFCKDLCHSPAAIAESPR